MRTPTTSAAMALILALTLAGCASNDTDMAEPAASAPAMSEDPAASEPALKQAEDEGMEKAEDEAMATEGGWIDQASYEADPATYHAAGDVVLFFNASWCPTCQATVKSLDAEGTPAGLTVVSVDFDNADDLRQQYGVTVQHTFVQVDLSGAELAKFTGSASGAEIAASTV